MASKRRGGSKGKAGTARTAKAGKTGKPAPRGAQGRALPRPKPAPVRQAVPRSDGNGPLRLAAPKVTPFLWFDDDLEEAVAFYKTVFPDVRMWGVTRYGEAGPGPKGTVMAASFSIGGQEFGAINGGPVFRFSESVSFLIDCKDQAEVDHYWGRLTADGGQESQCGWLKDRFGLSWQVVPRRLTELLGHKDPRIAARAMQAMMPMRKIDIASIEAAAFS